MKFSKFKENWGRKAVLFILSDESQERVFNWASSVGFDLTKSFSGNPQNPEDFDFHVTIICSENEALITNDILTRTPIQTTFSGFEVLGKRDEESKGVPVILVNKTPEMLETRKFYETFHCLYDNWPDWKAHMSLSYNWDGNPDLEALTLPNFPIIFDKIKVSNLD